VQLNVSKWLSIYVRNKSDALGWPSPVRQPTDTWPTGRGKESWENSPSLLGKGTPVLEIEQQAHVPLPPVR